MSVLAWIQAHGCQSQTTPIRAAQALAAGAAVGASLVAVGAALLPLAGVPWSDKGPEASVPLYAAAAIILAFPIAFGAFAIGLTAIAPLWWGLHSVGVRCWSAATPLGALLSGGVMFLFNQSLSQTAFMAFVGAVVGWTIWKVAYRRASDADSQA